MKQWRERVKQGFRSKRGASTLEYIIIIAVGALFAGLLLAAMNSPDIQQSLREKVEEVLNGTPSNHDIEKPPLPTLPQISTSDRPKPPSFSDVQPMNPPAKKEPSFLDQLKQKTMDGINWAGNKIDQGIDWLGKQKDQILNDDIKRAINEPGAYFSEVFGLEDYKAAWERLTSDPLGYAKDSWNNLKASINDIIENPITLIFDQDMFMEAWNGKDKNGKSIPLPNRLWNMVESLPTPVKLVKVGRIAKDTLVPDSCHCPTENPKKDNDGDKKQQTQKRVEKDKSLKPGTPEHKKNRWEVYKANGGKMNYEHWSNRYDANIGKPSRSHELVEKYRQSLGWGTTQYSVDTPNGLRILDIADGKTLKGIEHKTTTKTDGTKGYFSRSPRIREELEKDKYLVEVENWDITWVFENADVSDPLLEDLKNAGIKVVIK